MTMKRFLITLVGSGGDQELKLVHPDAEKWLRSDTSKSIPKKLFEGEEPDDGYRLDVSGSSTPDNDRALSCPGESFGSSEELIEHMNAEGVVLTGVYVGMIY